MTNIILEKASCKAKISKCTKSSMKMLNVLIYRSIKHLTVQITRERLSRLMDVSFKTVDRCIVELQRLGLLKVISGKSNWTWNTYIVNPDIFTFADELKDNLFSLKQYIYERTVSFLAENVSPYIDNIRSQFNNSSFSIFFKKKVGTVSPESRSIKKNSYLPDCQSAQREEKGDSWIEKCVESFWFYTPSLETMPVNKLSPEEFTKILEEEEKKPKKGELHEAITTNIDDTCITDMFRHIKFDCLGSEEVIYT